MREPTLEGLLHQLTYVVSAMSTSEEKWLSYVRRVRVDYETRTNGTPQSAASHLAPSAPPPQESGRMVVGDEWRAAPIDGPPSDGSRTTAEAVWPTAADHSPEFSTGDSRNYNFFAELDEKLARLRQRTVDASRT
jgi:hypothetical protein